MLAAEKKGNEEREEEHEEEDKKKGGDMSEGHYTGSAAQIQSAVEYICPFSLSEAHCCGIKDREVLCFLYFDTVFSLMNTVTNLIL